MGLYFGEVEAFPSNTTILIKMSSLTDDNSNQYETEINRDENLLASLLRRLHVQFEPSKPCSEFKKFSLQILKKHIGNFYCEEDNIKKLLTKFRLDLTPKQEFPDGGIKPKAGRIPKTKDADIVNADNVKTENPISNIKDTAPYNTIVSEAIKIHEPIVINNQLIKENSTIIFYHKIFLDYIQ
jgi:hypothetical protein